MKTISPEIVRVYVIFGVVFFCIFPREKTIQPRPILDGFENIHKDFEKAQEYIEWVVGEGIEEE